MPVISRKVSAIALVHVLAAAVAMLPSVSRAVPRDAGANNGAVLKLQAMVKSLTAERDAAKTEAAAMAGELEQLKKDKAAALAAKDSLGSELAARKNSADAVRNRLESTESRLRDVSDKYTQTSNAKAALETDLAALQAKQRETEQQLQSCGQHNVKLLQSAQELLERYQNKGRFAGLLQDEPLLQFHSVEVQNIAQEYQDQISAGEFAAKTLQEER